MSKPWGVLPRGFDEWLGDHRQNIRIRLTPPINELAGVIGKIYTSSSSPRGRHPHGGLAGTVRYALNAMTVPTVAVPSPFSQ
jgi:hypothetical protein